jgi:methyl coenzyme M reductase subunit D
MSDEIEIVDLRNTGKPVDHGKNLPKIVVGDPAHGSLQHPVVKPISGEGIVAVEPINPGIVINE